MKLLFQITTALNCLIIFIAADFTLTRESCFNFCNHYTANTLRECRTQCYLAFRTRNSSILIASFEDCTKYCDAFPYFYRSRCKYYCNQQVRQDPTITSTTTAKPEGVLTRSKTAIRRRRKKKHDASSSEVQAEEHTTI